jgi:hypothetical protein
MKVFMPSSSEEGRYCSWLHSTRMTMLIVTSEALFSDSHPEYTEDDSIVGDAPKSPEPEKAPQETQAVDKSDAPTEAMISQDILQKFFVFAVVMAVVVFIVKRTTRTKRTGRYDAISQADR